jgi:hypothetical protein
MRNRIVKVGVLSAFCAIAVSLSVLTGCADPGDKRKLLIAQVDLTYSSTTMQAFVWCIPAGSHFPVDGTSTTVTVNGEPVPSSIYGNTAVISLRRLRVRMSPYTSPMKT